MDFECLRNEKYAIDILAESLINGTLVLFLGTGVSVGAGLPRWPDLIKSMRAEVGLSSENLGDSDEALQDAAD